MHLPSLLDEIEQLANRAHMIILESLDTEVAADGQDDDRVEVVGKEAAIY